ncbi:MAG: hypothetical protein AUK35_03965 [Zetaproteobacteria bacterium CG2_30_46_52]|nr:MAG: hypothetical protein AUK35_03965 [Zetaproteobacteria bacterium CG2_30_46_52]
MILTSTNTFQPSTSHAITRSVFQTMLHEALVADAHVKCEGLLGATKGSAEISAIAVASTPEKVAKTMTSWAEDGLYCLGLFHVLGDVSPELLLRATPASYIDVAISLGEKGRLDIFATKQNKSGVMVDSQVQAITLDLIEDGHTPSNA